MFNRTSIQNLEKELIYLIFVDIYSVSIQLLAVSIQLLDLMNEARVILTSTTFSTQNLSCKLI